MSIHYAVMVGAIGFVLQYALLRLTDNRVLRMIPVYVTAAGAVLAVLCRLGILVGNDGGFINGGAIAAVVILICLVFWSIGSALGCLVWFVSEKNRNSRQ